MLQLLILWLGVSTPLVFFGAYLGYKQDVIEYPIETSDIPRKIPNQPWYMSTPITLLFGGLLPLGSCFVEIHFILSSVWMGYYYYVFGFLLLVYIIMIIICAEITFLFTYSQLCHEDYRWWWRSFGISGSTAIWIFFYSCYFFRELEATSSFTAYVLYFGYMGLASFGLFLMTGFIGVAARLWFNKTIFTVSSLRVD